MTLNESWKNCLRMWRWVVKEWKKDKSQDVNDLKIKWLTRYFPDVSLEADCFFCEYSEQNDASCSDCPGRLVGKKFSCCRPSYDYEYKPDKFLAKLEQLNKKRLGKK